ncbi:hypothetical protein AN480_29830 (plasmid) [Mycobacterium intracellulare subsp. chimaera]|nr:hypothetical protein AN480_29830 [Mycobacterium intracellulare subsp. chimaera]
MGVPGDDTQGMSDDDKRKAAAAAAAGEFPANEDDAASQFQGLGSGDQLPQMMSSMVGAVTGALGGVLGPLTQLPQELMQAGQSAISPLMSAVKGGGDGADLAGDDSLDGLPGDELVDAASSGGGGEGGGAGGGVGDGTTPAAVMGPPPVPASAPTTPAASVAGPVASPSSPSGQPAGSSMGGSMMPMMPGGAGGGDSKGDKVAEKKIAAPGVPNGQPVRGRLTPLPNVPVTKSVEAKPKPQVTATKRIAADEG